MFARGLKLVSTLTVGLVLATAACNSGNTANVQNPPPPSGSALGITFQSTPPSSVTVGSTASFTAVVTNDSTNGGSGSGVDWTISCSSANCGLLSIPHTASGQAVTYTSPSSMAGNAEVVNVSAFATADHTKNVLTSITVTALGSSLMGTYVLQAQGVQNTAPFQIVSVVVLDGNGNVTSGEQTINFLDPNTSVFTSASGPVVATGSSYFVGPDGRGTITINPTVPNGVTLGPQTFSFAYLSNAHLLVAAQPNNNNPLSVSASGTMDLQSSSALSSLSGGYAFAMGGTDFNGAGPVGLGGVLNVDNKAGNPNNISGVGSTTDENVFETPVPRVPVTGTVSTPDPFGGFTLSLNLNDITGTIVTPTVTVAGYIVDGTTVRLIESDSGGAGFLAGVAIAQGPSTGSYTSPASFSGTYVFDLLGVDFLAGLPDTFTAAGTITAGGDSTVPGGYGDFAFQTLTNPVTGVGPAQISGAFSGSYNTGPSSTGRYEAFLGHFPAPNGAFPPQLIFYLAAPDSPAPVLAFASATSTYPYPFVAVGLAYPQSTGPFTFSGPYGLYFSQQNGIEFDGTGGMTVAPLAFSGAIDVGTDTDQSFAGTVSSMSCPGISNCFPASFANGVGSSGLQGTNLNNSSIAFTSDIYLINSTQGFFVENDLAEQGIPQVTLGYFAAATSPQQSAAAKRKNRRK